MQNARIKLEIYEMGKAFYLPTENYGIFLRKVSTELIVLIQCECCLGDQLSIWSRWSTSDLKFFRNPIVGKSFKIFVVKRAFSAARPLGCTHSGELSQAPTFQSLFDQVHEFCLPDFRCFAQGNISRVKGEDVMVLGILFAPSIHREVVVLEVSRVFYDSCSHWV